MVVMLVLVKVVMQLSRRKRSRKNMMLKVMLKATVLVGLRAEKIIHKVDGSSLAKALVELISVELSDLLHLGLASNYSGLLHSYPANRCRLDGSEEHPSW